jgi:uncharacterized membrane protein YcaP (DUF421 family)
MTIRVYAAPGGPRTVSASIASRLQDQRRRTDRAGDPPLAQDGDMELLGASPETLLRTAVVGSLAYLALVAMLRISGKRTLSQMNAFDFVVTVALGSTLATILLTQDVPLGQGLVALALLIGLQFLITWTSMRSARVSNLVKSEPTALVWHGRMLPAAMARERMLEEEVDAALREHGLAGVEQAELVILETDGTISVVSGVGDEAWRSDRLRSLAPDEVGP